MLYPPPTAPGSSSSSAAGDTGESYADTVGSIREQLRGLKQLHTMDLLSDDLYVSQQEVLVRQLLGLPDEPRNTNEGFRRTDKATAGPRRGVPDYGGIKAATPRHRSSDRFSLLADLPHAAPGDVVSAPYTPLEPVELEPEPEPEPQFFSWRPWNDVAGNSAAVAASAPPPPPLDCPSTDSDEQVAAKAVLVAEEAEGQQLEALISEVNRDDGWGLQNITLRRRLEEWMYSAGIGGNPKSTSVRGFDVTPLLDFAAANLLHDAVCPVSHTAIVVPCECSKCGGLLSAGT